MAESLLKVQAETQAIRGGAFPLSSGSNPAIERAAPTGLRPLEAAAHAER